MPRYTRRVALGALTVGAASGVAAFAVPFDGSSALLAASTVVAKENLRKGSTGWRIGGRTRACDDFRQQVQGFASATSINAGESLNFHVSADPKHSYTIAIYRLGHYGGAGGRLMETSPVLWGGRQADPDVDEFSGTITCPWSVSWTLQTTAGWRSGLYQAVYTNTAGWRSITPFVVREDQRKASLCVVLPFSTYQAYNQWPRDGRLGKSLYRGYEAAVATEPMKHAPLSYPLRAFKVSFDRPYANTGRPSRYELDHEFVQWVESAGYDVTYVSSVDLQDGRVDPRHYSGLVFSGHDEYWTDEMRGVVDAARAAGTSVAFMAANNVYWKARMESSSDGRPSRVVVCYRENDPEPGLTGATGRWRELDGGAEQGMLGVQYNGIPAKPTPLVVAGAEHWLWAGCGVKNGDLINRVVAGEADGLHPGHVLPKGARQTLLSASPYKNATGTAFVQNTSLCEFANGSVLFVAGTFNWVFALNAEGFVDKRIQRATANLFDRMVARPAAVQAGLTAG